MARRRLDNLFPHGKKVPIPSLTNLSGADKSDPTLTYCTNNIFKAHLTSQWAFSLPAVALAKAGCPPNPCFGGQGRHSISDGGPLHPLQVFITPASVLIWFDCPVFAKATAGEAPPDQHPHF